MALDGDHVADAQPGPLQAFADRLALSCDGEHVHLVLAADRQLLERVADEERALGHHGFGDLERVVLVVGRG